MTAPPTRDIVITRIINAPIATVWNAWTDPEQVIRWWGPSDYTSPGCQLDLREGGRYLFAMRAPASQGSGISYTAGVYKEIVEQERLVFTQCLADANGRCLPGDELPENFPAEILTTISFRDIDGLTELVITESGWWPSLMSVFAYAGMHQSLDKLSTVLAG